MNKIFGMIKKYQAIIKYLIFGVLTTVVNIVSYYLCYEVAGISNIVSTVISWLIAVLFAFVTNKLFVFDSKKWDRNAVKEIINFFSFRIITGIVEVLMMYVFVDVFAFNGTVMKLITNIIVIILNYIASKIFVFKKQKTNETF